MAISSIKITNIINMLALKSTQESVNAEAIDQQFVSLLKTVEKYFEDLEYDLLFDWLNELIKKETDLKHKQQENFRVFKKDSINLLICKVNMFHSRIIELFVNSIDDAYHDYRYIGESSPTFANQIKAETITTVNKFINNLTDNRHINEKLFDQYIEIISQSLKIFSI